MTKKDIEQLIALDIDVARTKLASLTEDELQTLQDDTQDAHDDWMSMLTSPYEDLMELIEEAQSDTPPELSLVGKTWKEMHERTPKLIAYLEARVSRTKERLRQEEEDLRQQEKV